MRLAVCSSKGGVGKTSTAANLAAVLAQRGRVLAVDADPQDSLGRAFGVVAKGREDSLAGLLEAPDADPHAVLRRDVAPGAGPASRPPVAGGGRRDPCPARGDRDRRPAGAAPAAGRLRPRRDRHPWGLGNLTLSAVCAADAVLTVFTSDPGSALGAARVTAFLEQHRQFENTSARLVGLACSLWDREGKAAREVIAALEGTDLPVLATRIPLSRRVPSSTLAKRPVVLSAPTSPVAAAYAALTDDVLTAYRELP